MKLSFNLLAVAGTLALAGCASKEPMDYLPEATNYVAVDMAQLRKEAGAKRAQDVLHKIDPTAPTDNEKLSRIYAGFSPGGGGQMYCVMIGQSGLSDTALNEMKKNGGSETKIDGTSAVTMRGVAATALTDSAVLMFAPPQALTTMRNTSKKKNTAAADTPLFKGLTRTLSGHGLAVAVNTKPFMTMADRPLAAMAIMNPKGVDAAKAVESFSMAMDWDQQPEAAGTLVLPGDDARKDLAGFLDSLKKMAGGQGGMVGTAAGILSDLSFTAGSDGVDFAVKIPRDVASGWLDNFEKMAETLPSDPQQRAMAIQKAIMQR